MMILPSGFVLSFYMVVPFGLYCGKENKVVTGWGYPLLNVREKICVIEDATNGE